MSHVIIFDTATRRVYCEDVHQVIAAPSGALVNYDYRERWVEPSAVAGLRVGASAILVYCELPGFDRAVDAQFYWGAEVVPEGTRFVVTRSAVIGAVKSEGGVFHLSLRLGGYLSVPPYLLEQQVRRLPSRPGKHFVVQSSEPWNTAWLLRSDMRWAWASVVENIQRPELQFKKDIFWRIESVKDGCSGFELKPDDRGCFNVRTGRSVDILLVSHVGRQAAADLAWESRRVRVHSVSRSPLLVVKGGEEISVRRAGESLIRVDFPVTAKWRKSMEVLTISSDVDGVLGSSVVLNFSLSHHPLRVFIGLLLAISAAAATVGATALVKDKMLLEGILLAGAAFVAGFFANKIIPIKVA